MRERIDVLRQALPQLIRTAVLRAAPDLPWRLDGCVYQYTRFEALLAMVGGPIVRPSAAKQPMSELWATSSVHLNDSQEFTRGREVIAKALPILPKDEVTRRMTRAVHDADALEVYCTCFSGVDDDLSQWRGYGADGTGVCIEFDLRKLIEGLDGVGCWLIYGKPNDKSELTQVAVAEKLVTYIHRSIATALPPGRVPEAVYSEVREQLAEIWSALFLVFKHQDFCAENEFRIVYSSAVGRTIEPAFRPDSVVPFVPLQMTSGKALPVTAIRLGPAVSTDINVRSLELLLSRLKLGDRIRVTKSDIPYVPR